MTCQKMPGQTQCAVLSHTARTSHRSDLSDFLRQVKGENMKKKKYEFSYIIYGKKNKRASILTNDRVWGDLQEVASSHGESTNNMLNLILKKYLYGNMYDFGEVRDYDN